MSNYNSKSIFKILKKYYTYSRSNLDKVKFEDVFKDFIKNGGDINEKNSEGLTALMVESQISGTYEIVEGLLKNGADPNLTDALGKTALIYAAIAGNYVTIEELLNNRAEINMKDNEGITALMYACNMKYEPYKKYEGTVFNLIHNPYLEINARDIKGRTALYHCSENYNSKKIDVRFNIMKQLLDKGADPSIDDIDNNANILLLEISRQYIYHNKPIIKLLLESDKININYQNRFGISVLHKAVEGSEEILKLILEKKPIIDIKDNNGDTPLQYLYYIIKNKNDNSDNNLNYDNNENFYYFLPLLIDAGADINSQNNDGDTLLMKLCRDIGIVNHIKTILLLPNININLKNADGKTAYDIALKVNDIEVANLLKPKSTKKWKGSSKADIEKYDAFFEKNEKGKNTYTEWSTCPICLDYIERSDGCMFIMGHDCAKTGHHYNKELYEKYVYEAPAGKFNIEWCTICGRITEFHKHFKLVSASADRAPLAKIDATIERRLNAGDNQVFFDIENCKKFGGGGIEEKVARFRRLREYALELQDDIDTKLEEDALDELIEEVWNAPLRREKKKIAKILEEKKFNIPSSNFPNVRPNVTRNNNNGRNYPNIPLKGLRPTIVNSGKCVIGQEDAGDTENPLYKFHHESRYGINHKESLICKDDLEGAITIKNKEFGIQSFGKCWENTCNAILYPGEIEGIVSDEVYQDYRKKFNKKMANVRNVRNGNNDNENENENENEIDRLAEMERNRRNGGRRKRVTKKNKKMKGGDIDHVLHKLDLSTVTCNRVFKKKM